MAHLQGFIINAPCTSLARILYHTNLYGQNIVQPYDALALGKQ